MSRIVEVGTFCAEGLALVRVRTEDGHEGWGQAAPYHADITALVLHRQVAPHALGQDDGDLTALGERVIEREHKFPGSHLVRALGGVDTALWDLRGRRAGRPVCELSGGSVRRLPVYASSMRRDIEPAEEAARLAGLQDRHGYRAVKFRIGRECGHDQDEWPGRTEAIVPAVRAAVAEGTTLLVDANSCYTPATAIEVGRMLQDEGVRHFEEPCPYWEQEWTAEVAAALDLDVTGGEQDCLLTTWFEAAGREQTVQQAWSSLDVGGEAVVVGLMPHQATVTLSAGPFVNEQVIRGCYFGSADLRRDVPALVGDYLSGNLLLDELITRRIGLEELNDAFDALRAGKGARSVLVLD